MRGQVDGSIACVLLALAAVQVEGQGQGQGQNTLPFTGAGSDQDPAICSLSAIQATESGGLPYGPLSACSSLTRSLSLSVNGETLPPSGVATIFTASSSSSSSQSQAPSSSSSPVSTPTLTSSPATGSSPSSTPSPTVAPSPAGGGQGQQNAGAASWMRRQNTPLLWATCLCLLIGVTYFFDQLLELLV